MEQTESFGYWLRRRRKALDLTQQELAGQVGCTTDTIKKIEADARRPSKQLAELLADHLQVPPEQRRAFLDAARARRAVSRLGLTANPLTDSERSAAPSRIAVMPTPLSRDTPLFVGRERELVALGIHLAAAIEGHGRIVFITGEAGQGKTALLAEFARRALAEREDLIVAQGAGDAIAGSGDPYLPFRDLLRMLSGDAEPALRQRGYMTELAHALIETGPDLINTFVPGAALLRRLAESAADTSSLRRRLQMLVERGRSQPGDLQQAPLFDQITSVLWALAAHSPMLLMLDDLQWADDASIQLLFHLGRRISGRRILIVGAYRLSDVALGRSALDTRREYLHPLRPVVNELKGQWGEIEIDLGQTPAEERRFVDALLDAEPNTLAESFRAVLCAHTKGHPLFTVELLRHLQARGDLVRDEQDRWSAPAEIDWGALPARVEAIVAQRVDRLDGPLHELLNVAAVEGEVFTAQVVARVLPMDESRVLGYLSTELAQRHRLTREHGEVSLGTTHLSRFTFGHVLFQQYLYHRLGAGERRLLHGAVARALEALYAERLPEISAQLAYHYAEAQEGEQAVPYLLRAGDRARGLYAHREANDLYQRALRFARESGDEEMAARVLMRLGLTYNIAFDFERARHAYEEGSALWKRSEARHADAPMESGQAPDRPLRLNWNDPETLDPAVPLSIWSVSMAGQFFSGLVTIGPDLEVLPDMAQSWEMRDDGRTYIFHLRDDAFWSDGRPVTAHDFAYAWRRTLDPATGAGFAALLLHDIRGARAFQRGESASAESLGITVSDDVTLKVELEVPSAYFIPLLAYPTTYAVPRQAIEAYGSAWTEPERIVTNGVYRLLEWRRHEQMSLEANPAYHGRRARMRRLELDLRLEGAALLARYESGALDLLNLWFLPPALMDRARQRNAHDYLSGPQLLTYYVVFNMRRAPFDDIRVRQAFALATDRERWAHVDMRGNVYPATGGFVPPGLPGHTPGIAMTPDIGRARALLADAGYPEGRDLPRLHILTRGGRAYLCKPLVAQWQEALGVEITVEELESPALEERLSQAPPPIFMHLWIADYPDPDCYLRVCVEDDQALFGGHNETFHRLIEQARRLTDQSERMELYAKAEQILVQEVPMLPLGYGRVHVLVKPWVKGYRPALLKQQFWKDLTVDADSSTPR